jgi:FkbM family methyltransferase
MDNKFIPLIVVCFILLYEALTHPIRTEIPCKPQHLRNTELNSFKTSNAEHESKRAELESQLNSLNPSETANDNKVITFRWLFLSKKETYEKITDPFYDILLDDIKNSRYVSSYAHWGPGWPSYNTKIGSLENLKKRYGEPLPFDVVMPFGIENADVKQLTNYGIVSVMRKHECRVNEKCVGSFGNNQVIAMVNPFEIATNPDIDKASTSKLLVHVPSPASSVYFRPFQEPRTIDISILGSVNGAYPMRTRWRSLMPKLRARGWSISEQNMNHKYWPGRSEALKMRQKYRDLAKNSKVILTGASFVFYSLQKFSEFAAAGGLMISTLPQDRTDDFKKFIVEVNPKMSDNQLIEIVEKYLKNDADRMEKTKLGQDWWEKNGRPDNFFKTVNTAVVDYKAGAVGKRFDFPFFIRCRAAGGQKWCPNGKYTPMPSTAPQSIALTKTVVIKPSTMPDYFTTPKPEPYCPAHRKASKRVAFIITNYNMPERTDQIVENIRKKVKWPVDIIVVDNGSDLQKQSKYTTLRLEKNVQTTNGWLVGLQYAKSLAAARKICYFAYWIWITTCLYDETQNDILTPLAQFLIDNPKAAGIGPALTKDSTTGWAHLKKVEGQSTPRRVKYVDELGVLWRASFFDSIGWFDPDELRGFGVDIETGYLARYSGRDVYVHDGVMVKKHSGIAYKMKRMNANAGKRGQLAIAEMHMCLKRRYTDDYYGALRTENQPLSKGTYTDRLGTWFDDYSTYPTYVSDGLPNIAIVAPVQPAPKPCPKPPACPTPQTKTVVEYQMKEHLPTKFKEWTQDKLKFNYVNTYTSGVLDGDNLWLPQRNWVNVDEIGGRGDGIPLGRSKFRTSKDKSPSISYDVVWYLAGVRDNNIQMFTTETYLKWHYILKSNPQKEFTVIISGSRGGCGSTPSYVREFCDTMVKGVGNAKCAAQEHAFSFKTMYVPGRIAVNYWPVLEEHRALFKPLIETFRKGLDIRQQESHPQVFLTRRDAKEGKTRVMEKYNDFLSLLTSWTLLDGSSLTTIQKAAYLSDTGQFALEAGAGIANVLFLPDNAVVSILCPPSFQKMYHGMRMCETMAQHATLFNPNIKTRVLDVGTFVKSDASNANNQHYKLKDMKKVIGWLMPKLDLQTLSYQVKRGNYPPIPMVLETKPGTCDLFSKGWCEKFARNQQRLWEHDDPLLEIIRAKLNDCIEKTCYAIDIGGNIGTMSSIMLQQGAHVTTYEPQGDLATAIKNTVTLNHWNDGSVVYHNAVVATPEEAGVTLNFGTRDASTRWGARPDGEHLRNIKAQSAITRQLSFPYKHYTFIKIDTDSDEDEKLTHFIIKKIQNGDITVDTMTCEATDTSSIVYMNNLDYSYSFIVNPYLKFKNKKQWFDRGILTKNEYLPLFDIQTSDEQIISELLADIIKEADIVFQKKDKDLQALSYQVKRGNYPPIPMVLETKPGTCDLFSKGWCEKFARNDYTNAGTDMPLIDIVVHYLKGCNQKTCYAIDIGSNLGYISSFMLQQGAHVTSYEPQGDFATALKNTVTLNHWNDYSVVNHNAVVATPEEAGVTLNFGTRDASTKWGWRPDGAHIKNIKPQSAQTILLTFPHKHYTFIKIDTDSVDISLLHKTIDHIKNGLQVDALTSEEVNGAEAFEMQQLGYKASLLITTHLHLKNSQKWIKTTITKRESLPLYDVIQLTESEWNSLFKDIRVVNIVFEKSK